MKSFFLALSATLLSILFAGYFTSTSASAATPYDPLVRLTDNLLLKEYNTTNENDYSTTWYADAKNATKDWCDNRATVFPKTCTLNQHLNDLLTDPNARWLVQKHGTDAIQIFYSFSPNARLEFQTNTPGYPELNLLGTKVYRSTYFTMNSTAQFRDKVNNLYFGNPNTAFDESSIRFGISSIGGTSTLLFSNFPITYPPNYQGLLLPDTFNPPTPPEDKTPVKPNYTYTVSESGELHLTYEKNIKPFLTGTSYVVIEKMTDNWQALDTHIDSITVQPAGWLDEKYQLPSHGYYMVRIDHDQQLDSPPWDAEKADETRIEQVWLQIHWNGTKALSGTTSACTDDICNEQREETALANRLLQTLGIPVFGLQHIVLSPLNYLSEISNSHESCTPLVLPLGFISNNITLPCMTPIYQQYFGSFFIVFQTILIGITAYYIGLRSFNSVKEISNPRNDQIETAKL